MSCKNEDEEIIKGCNAGVVMENMLLEAADLGLGAVYLFGVSQVLFANEEITKLLQIHVMVPSVTNLVRRSNSELVLN